MILHGAFKRPERQEKGTSLRPFFFPFTLKILSLLAAEAHTCSSCVLCELALRQGTPPAAQNTWTSQAREVQKEAKNRGFHSKKTEKTAGIQSIAQTVGGRQRGQEPAHQMHQLTHNRHSLCAHGLAAGSP